MILYTFLEQRDLSGKTIIPFCTHGGSGFSRTIETIRRQSAGDGFRCLPAEYGHSAGWRRSLTQKNRIQPLAPVQPRRTG